MAIGDSPQIISSAGFECGRMQPENYTPVDGDFAWVIGSDVEDQIGEVAVGDIAGIEQAIDFTDLNKITFALKFRQSVMRRAAVVYCTDPGTYPTNFAGGETLDVKIDGGSVQTFTFQDIDQSLAQVVARIAATLSGAAVTGDQKNLRIESATEGDGSKVEVENTGTANAKLGFDGTEEDTGEAITFRLAVKIDDVEVYSLQPAEGEAPDYVKRTLNVSNIFGNRTLRVFAEAVTA